MKKQLQKMSLWLLLILFTSTLQAQEITKPSDFFGFEPGSDRMVFGYEKMIEYLQKVDAESTKLKMIEIGQSPLGRPMYIAFVSSEANLNNLENLREINKRLALDPNIATSEKETMIKNGKVFLLATLSMHSNEVGPSQAFPTIVHQLLTATDAETMAMLDEVVYMVVPSHNPDGMNMIVDNFNKYKGTKYEGSSMPGVYHKYVGHDNNRDFVILTQSDTKAISYITGQTWFPQAMVEKHQMSSIGPRYFVPPNHDPIAENIDAELFLWSGVFGQNMATDMKTAGLTGISQHYAFDYYWPGATQTSMWKNVISFLTEAASVHIAKPIYIEPTELIGRGKGLSEYKKGINMPAPWTGGWWRLSDIMQYEIESTYSIIHTSYLYKERILRFRNAVCVREVNRGLQEAPYYYIIPKVQHNQSELVELVNLLNEHGLDVYELNENQTLDGRVFAKGDIVVPLAQPFRAFVKEIMEIQYFPERHYTPNGKLIKPYDITSWSLPLHKGLESYEIDIRSEAFEKKWTEITSEYSLSDNQTANDYAYVILSANNNESYQLVFEALAAGVSIEQLDAPFETAPAGSFVIKKNKKLNKLLEKAKVTPLFTNNAPNVATRKLDMPRIALVETYMHDMDAGWTRFVFDTYQLPFTVVHPGDFESTDFSKFDVVIFPDANSDVLMHGKYKRGGAYHITSYPPEYTKGIGSKGMAKLMAFSENGGIVISWGKSTKLFDGELKAPNGEKFQLPYSDISSGLNKKGLYCPGSFVQLLLKPDHPLTYGMEASTGVFYRGKPVFSTSFPNFDMDRRVIGTFPEKNILLSGYMENEKLISNRAGMIWMKKGKGQFILMAFSPIFRSSTPTSYKLVFNSILLPKL